MVTKVKTNCCALAQMTASNDSLEEIVKFIKQRKEESETLIGKQAWKFANDFGERAYFCITTAKETELEKNLESAGFKVLTEINRRHCYDETKLKMWMINW